MEINSFITFGCWNKGSCNPDDPSTSPMSSVMNKLITVEKTPNFYVVLGDNYYPRKEKIKGIPTKKFFDSANFKSGFDCAVELDSKAPVYMLMGNHDLDRTFLYIDSSKTENKDPCYITREEIKYPYFDKFDMDQYFTMLGDHTLLLFLNTSLYVSDVDDIDGCVQLYRGLEDESLKNIKEHDKNILNILAQIYSSKDIKNIILLGHHPIISIREKYTENNFPTFTEDGILFIKSLYSRFPEAKKYYICADVHQYQESDITFDKSEESEMTITQYVVGTGGTDLDDKECSTKFPSSSSLSSASPFYDHDLGLFVSPRICNNKVWGYLKVSEKKDNDLELEFIETKTKTKTKTKTETSFNSRKRSRNKKSLKQLRHKRRRSRKSRKGRKSRPRRPRRPRRKSRKSRKSRKKSRPRRKSRKRSRKSRKRSRKRSRRSRK